MRPHKHTCASDADEGYEAVAAAVARSADEMPAESREAVRARLMARIAPVRRPWYARFTRPTIALATAATLVGGVGYAAAASAPGSTLYPLKRSVTAAVDAVQHTFAPGAASPEAHAPVPLTAGDSGRRSGPGPAGGASGAGSAAGAAAAEPRGFAGSKAATASKPGGTAGGGANGQGNGVANGADNGKKGTATSSPETTRGQEQRAVPEKRHGAGKTAKGSGKK